MLEMTDSGEIKALLRAAVEHKMTANEVKKQRISWAYGQMMDSNQEVTREQVEQAHVELYGW